LKKCQKTTTLRLKTLDFQSPEASKDAEKLIPITIANCQLPIPHALLSLKDFFRKP